MQKGMSTSVVVAIIAVIAIVLSGALLFMKKKNSDNIVQVPQVQQTINEQMGDAKITEKQKDTIAYENKQYGVTFQYPKKYTLKMRTDGCVELKNDKNIALISLSSNPDLACYPIRTGVGLDTKIEQMPDQTVEIMKKTAVLKFVNISEMGENQVKQNSVEGDIILTNTDEVAVSFSVQDQSELKHVIDSMMTLTFKETSWKTFASKEYSFEYPDSWVCESDASIVHCFDKERTDFILKNDTRGDGTLFTDDVSIEFAAKMKETKSMEELIKNDAVVQKLETIVIDGFPVNTFVMGGYGSNYIIESEVLGRLLNINFQAANSKEQLTNAQQHILSTFKFVK